MLHLFPPPLHRRLLQVAHGVRIRWWRIRRPRLHGCRVLAFDREERVLLVRHSYGSGNWMPPGGGLARGEDPLAGAMRELWEETGCRLHEAAEITREIEQVHGAGNTVHIVAGRTFDMPCPDGREIVETRFFALEALPEQMSAMLREQLPGWLRATTAARPGPPAPGPPPAPTG